MLGDRAFLAAMLACGALFCPPPALAAQPIVLAVDRDDDDTDGTPDGQQSVVPPEQGLYAIARPAGTRDGRAIVQGASVRVLADGKPLPPSGAIAAGVRRIELQAVAAGLAEVQVFGQALEVSALEVWAVGGGGDIIDLTRSHASFQRTPPDRLGDDPFAHTADPDALRFVLGGPAAHLPTTLTIASLAPSGLPLDVLTDVPLGHVPCPEPMPATVTCGSTRPIRVVADEIDRNHPLVKDRSIKGELGGALVLFTPEGRKLQMIRIAGPRRSAVGPIDRHLAKLRIIMVRTTAGGPAPMGGNDAGAIEVARSEVRRANALWAACGISFGDPASLNVTIADPPRPHMLAIGCDQGLPATGGTLRLRVDDREVSVRLSPGQRPAAAARRMASAIGAAGFFTRVSDNAVIGAGAYGSSDVLVRHRDGSLASLDRPASGPVSTDPTMTACIGRVDLEDGLEHFNDVDAIAGTVEERALIKAFDDGDPSSIEVIMVPSFSGGGRIGESFIFADGGAVRNTIVEDRAGIRADRASFALAHELGHVLLDDPGHPDDFGVDTPTRLMDADAANASAYGPRRLLVQECVRAIRQSGPGAPITLLKPWPLAPIGRRR